MTTHICPGSARLVCDSVSRAVGGAPGSRVACRAWRRAWRLPARASADRARARGSNLYRETRFRTQAAAIMVVPVGRKRMVILSLHAAFDVTTSHVLLRAWRWQRCAMIVGARPAVSAPQVVLRRGARRVRRRRRRRPAGSSPCAIACRGHGRHSVCGLRWGGIRQLRTRLALATGVALVRRRAAVAFQLVNALLQREEVAHHAKQRAECECEQAAGHADPH